MTGCRDDPNDKENQANNNKKQITVIWCWHDTCELFMKNSHKIVLPLIITDIILCYYVGESMEKMRIRLVIKYSSINKAQLVKSVHFHANLVWNDASSILLHFPCTFFSHEKIARLMFRRNNG